MDKNTDTSTAKQRIIFENERTKEMYELFIVTHTIGWAFGYDHS